MGLTQKMNRNRLDRNGDRPPEVTYGLENLFDEFYGKDEYDDDEEIEHYEGYEVSSEKKDSGKGQANE